MPDVLGTCLNISAPLKSLLRSPRVATPDYNQGNERREATSPRELKRASALKEKGVPKATTQDSCFSHMICKGQSLREQPVEVRRAGEGQKVSPALTDPRRPTGYDVLLHLRSMGELRGAASKTKLRKAPGIWEYLF